ncbi:MAG: DNA topoisomerase I, partial [Thaumarchaeota archaeon]|nr:DNA topoisomerase I [Nitrososphaerota archaeon]
ASYEEVDFSEFFRKADEEKAQKERATKEEKKALGAVRKQRREVLKAQFGKAMIDGREVDIANWMIEPPGIFTGRGLHPMRGKWKPRVNESDVVLNLGESSAVPPGNWKEIVHDHDSMWMAKWVDKLTDKEKYVWLHESAPLQQSRNRAKYDNAMKVGANLQKIKDRIAKGLVSKDETRRQVATVCWLIDNLGMRVGDEKDEDEADTVGASTLRVEHVKMKGQKVEFDFLGKDSVPWKKEATPPPEVINNLTRLSAGKRPAKEIFHDVDSGMVNEFLSSIVPGVTAKVFRTYHATATTEEALRSRDLRDSEELDKVYHAKEANLTAAIFCNHQRTPPKTWDQSLQKKKQKLEETKTGAKSGERVRKLEKELDFFVRTKNYNLNTSLKNYIDPRVYKSWCDYVGLEWAKIYSKSMQRKFSWVEQSETRWEHKSPPIASTTPQD